MTATRHIGGDEVEPEVVVETQIEQRSVEIEEDRIYLVPVQLFNGNIRNWQQTFGVSYPPLGTGAATGPLVLS